MEQIKQELSAVYQNGVNPLKEESQTLLVRFSDRPCISCLDDAFELLKPLANDFREYVVVLHLDSALKCISREIVHIGGLDSVRIDVRATFRNAIVQGSNSIIVAHNHPSGNSQPSAEDYATTRDLVKAGTILGIKIVDAIVFTEDRCTSFIGDCK